MKVVLLGTGGYFPTPQRQTACLMLPEMGIVLDAGTGMCRIARHLQTDRLDIFLSHAHLDHVAGLTYLINVLPPSVLANTVVHGDEAKLNAVREHLFATAIFPVPPEFKFAPLTSSFALAQDGTLTHFPLQHPGGSIGFRLDWPGHSLAYVTDTTATDDASYIDSIRGIDLLIHESYFRSDVDDLPAITGHSALAAVAGVAAKAKVKRLVMVHIDPLLEDESGLDLAQVCGVFPSAAIGHDGDELEF